MSDWVHIEPPAPRLTPVQERIREMLRAGKTFRQICVALMIRSDHLRDEIFEIRKYEAIMGKGKNLTQEQKATIVAMHDAGIGRNEIAQQVGCAPKSVYAVLRAAKAREQYHEKKTGINPEFDAAVNDMIEEMHAEETAEPEEIEQTAEPYVMNEEHTAAPPDAVMDAVRDKIDELQKQVDERAAEIALLNEKIRSLNAWLMEVQA